MTAGETGRQADLSALSCFTTAIARYLTGEVADVAGHLARSIRLAIVTGGQPAFVHHRYSLAELPGPDRLAYASAADPDEVLDAVGTELAGHGRVIVVGNTAGMPWAPGYRGADDTHWFLVDDSRPGHWHVVDAFAALLPNGEQRPHAGWLSSAELTEACAPRRRLTPHQRNRDRYAFGPAVPTPPADRFWWVARGPAAGEPSAAADPVVHGAAALASLADQLAEMAADAGTYLPDVWAASRHRLFQLAWPTVRDAIAEQVVVDVEQAWRVLPRTLRFAVESAQRGRPRSGLVRKTFHTLARLEAELPSPEPGGDR